MAKVARRLAGARAQLVRWATLACAIGALSVATVLYLPILQFVESGGADGSPRSW